MYKIKHPHRNAMTYNGFVKNGRGEDSSKFRTKVNTFGETHYITNVLFFIFKK